MDGSSDFSTCCSTAIFVITVVAAIFAFATIVTLGLPCSQRDAGIRMKSVSARREELRQKHHAALKQRGAACRTVHLHEADAREAEALQHAGVRRTRAAS
jgi:hypothetical protein